jgi:hypothetical protein
VAARAADQPVLTLRPTCVSRWLTSACVAAVYAENHLGVGDRGCSEDGRTGTGRWCRCRRRRLGDRLLRGRAPHHRAQSLQQTLSDGKLTKRRSLTSLKQGGKGRSQRTAARDPGSVAARARAQIRRRRTRSRQRGSNWGSHRAGGPDPDPAGQQGVNPRCPRVPACDRDGDRWPALSSATSTLPGRRRATGLPESTGGPGWRPAAAEVAPPHPRRRLSYPGARPHCFRNWWPHGQLEALARQSPPG